MLWNINPGHSEYIVCGSKHGRIKDVRLRCSLFVQDCFDCFCPWGQDSGVAKNIIPLEKLFLTYC
jgi:hypothetical protein